MESAGVKERDESQKKNKKIHQYVQAHAHFLASIKFQVLSKNKIKDAKFFSQGKRSS